MKIGFTGTRHGMTEPQKLALIATLETLTDGGAPVEGHHGDCVGADAEFHFLIRVHVANVRRVIHPPTEDKLRAWCVGEEERQSLTYFARNRAIVNECDVLIAAPPTCEHQSRGGTWYTVDFAKKVGKNVFLVLPNGTVRLEART